MSEDRFLELAPLAALGILDGEDRSAFESHVASCVLCRAEVLVHESVAALIPLALTPVAPARRLRERIVSGEKVSAAPRHWPTLLAAAASVALAVGLLVLRGQRDTARAEAQRARVLAEAAQAEARASAAALDAVQHDLGEAVAFRALVQRRQSRITALAGLPAAPRAVARVIWDPTTREAVLVASGLDPAPAGKAYQAWVIASGAPVAAGVFRPDAEGRAVLRLPAVDETSRAKTFAVTLEPEAGVPAPTGPMVLAGAV
jgi:hypothetical protein